MEWWILYVAAWLASGLGSLLAWLFIIHRRGDKVTRGDFTDCAVVAAICGPSWALLMVFFTITNVVRGALGDRDEPLFPERKDK